MSSIRYKKRKIYSEINVTPFVDVMLVLLIIFMVTAPMLVTGLDIDIPQSNTKPINSKSQPLTISVDKNSVIFIMNEKILMKQLQFKLKNILKSKLDSRIFIKADKGLHYGYIMQLISEVTNTGFNKISLITESK